MDIDMIKEEISLFDDAQFIGGVSEETILEAESILKVQFPSEYRAFLYGLGSGYVSSEEFIGLGGSEHLNVVWITNNLRSRHSISFPHNLIPLRNDGYGNYDCINLHKQSENPECEIVEYLHDGKSAEYKKLATSFFVWFQDILKIVRELDAEDD